jgi:hypothetical protein
MAHLALNINHTLQEGFLIFKANWPKSFSQTLLSTGIVPPVSWWPTTPSKFGWGKVSITCFRSSICVASLGSLPVKQIKIYFHSNVT